MHIPVPETIQYMVKGQQKYPKNINPQKKEKTDTDQIWQAQTKDSVVSLRLAKIQEDAFSLMFKAQNLMLLDVRYLMQYVFLMDIN